MRALFCFCLVVGAVTNLLGAPPDAAIVVQPGGSLGGPGAAVVDTAVWVEGGGLLEPGNPFGPMSIDGTLNLQSSSLFVAELGGTNASTNYDSLTATGAVNISGNLQVLLLNNFVPADADTFAILSGSSVTGTFVYCSLPLLPARKTLRATYNSSSVHLVVGLIATYGEWKCTRFTIPEQGNAALSGPAVDLDKDDLTNELEYFFGTEPKDAGSARRVKPSIVTDLGQRYFTLTFPRAQGITDASFVVEKTNNLLDPNSWTAASSTIVNSSSANNIDTLDVRVVPALNSSDIRVFYRVRIQ